MQPPHDPALQRQYDNPARVPEHPAIIAGWAADAAAYRRRGGQLDIPYGPSPRQRYDLFGPQEAPIAVFIHGGYWQKLDKSSFSHCAAGLNAHGVAVAVLGFDLCPDVSIRDILRQVQAACAALPRRPALAFGHSAGGHLAAMLLASGHVPAALPVSGVFELAPLRHTTIGAALQLTAAEARALSPRFLPPPPPPGGWLHAVVGSAESTEFRRQTHDFAAAWGGTAEELPGLDHFTVLAPFSDPKNPLIARMLRAITG
jgi:arylformamidase